MFIGTKMFAPKNKLLLTVSSSSNNNKTIHSWKQTKKQIHCRKWMLIDVNQSIHCCYYVTKHRSIEANCENKIKNCQENCNFEYHKKKKWNCLKPYSIINHSQSLNLLNCRIINKTEMSIKHLIQFLFFFKKK